jgi:hypothetical protein
MTTRPGARIVLICILSFSLFSLNRARGGSLHLIWNASLDPSAVGYTLYHGLNSGAYIWSMNVGSNLTGTVTGLTPGLTYYFAVTAYNSNGLQSLFSNQLTNRLPILPTIIAQPLSQSAIAAAPATLTVSALGDPPLGYQWVNGSTPIDGATASALSWSSIGDANAGNYTVIVSNPWGSVTSSVATLTVIDPPLIITQPQSETVIATTAASFSSAVSGSAPLSIQWYKGTKAIAGATTISLSWSSTLASTAGSYDFTVSNVAGTVTSSVVSLTVLPTNTIATAAGVYNGLFYQTNAQGAPIVTEATSGLFANGVVSTNGAFSARVYLSGSSYPLAGAFNISGNASAKILGAGTNLSNLSVVLRLDLINGTQQMTGAISSTNTGNAWTAALVANLATNAYTNLSVLGLVISPGLSADSPTNPGTAFGHVVKGVLTLAGTLGDASTISQIVPISQNGEVPLYFNLYNNLGLLEGWINLADGPVIGNLTWIRPSGILVPPGFPQGFDTQVQVTTTNLLQ